MGWEQRGGEMENGGCLNRCTAASFTSNEFKNQAGGSRMQLLLLLLLLLLREGLNEHHAVGSSQRLHLPRPGSENAALNHQRKCIQVSTEDASGCGWLIEKESKQSLLRRSGGGVEPAELTHSPCCGVWWELWAQFTAQPSQPWDSVWQRQNRRRFCFRFPSVLPLQQRITLLV